MGAIISKFVGIVKSHNNIGVNYQVYVEAVFISLSMRYERTECGVSRNLLIYWVN
jgi:hypothetical protein